MTQLLMRMCAADVAVVLVMLMPVLCL